MQLLNRTLLTFFDKNKWNSTNQRARMPFDTDSKKEDIFDPHAPVFDL